MPGRPARRWMGRCLGEVAAAGSAESPGAVCASTWKRKTERDKRAIVKAEEGRSVKKKKKKKHPHHKKTAHHAHRTAKRSKKRKGGKKHGKHTRCGSCGHSAAHGASGCTHFAGGKFCTCKHRG
jgi:hypothetical protein